jgi:hypothetical protein
MYLLLYIQIEGAFGRESNSEHFQKTISYRDSILGLTGMGMGMGGESSSALLFYETGPLFDLNEGQILACAKEILYSCNRTHSGGDTYDCVNSVMCHDRFAVLTPFDAEAEPMEIRIDIIQRESSRVVVHNTWLDKAGSGYAKGHGHGGPAVSDGDVPKSSDMLSPFRRLGSGRKLRKKDKRNSDPGLAVGGGGGGGHRATPTGDDAGDETTPTANNRSHKTHVHATHKRTGTGSSASTMTTTPRQPDFSHRDTNDYDENTSDDEYAPHSKKAGGGEWQNPASSAADFDQPLGIGTREREREPSQYHSLPPNLPPPTLTNVNRDRWGNSLSSFPDESSQSQGSSNGGQTSVSSSDNSGKMKSRIKAMFTKASSENGFLVFGKKRLESTDSELDCKPSNTHDATATTTSASASGSSSGNLGSVPPPPLLPPLLPPLPLHGMQRLDLNDISGDTGGGRADRPPAAATAGTTSASASASGATAAAGAAPEAVSTPRKVISVEDLSSGGDEEEAGTADSPPPSVGKHTRFIKHTSHATDVTDRPMCIRIEVTGVSV